MSTMNPSTQYGHAAREALAGLGSIVRRPIEAAAFWAAIALPFLYLPLLAQGFSSNNELFVFAGLLVLNALALVVGHGYRQ
jgi:hypothetical protein